MNIDEKNFYKNYNLITVNKMYYPEIGGVEVTAKQIAELAAKIGFKSSAIVSSLEKTVKTEIVNNVLVHRIPSVFSKGSIRYSPEMFDWIKENDGYNTIYLFHFPSVTPELFFKMNKDKLKAYKICLYHADITGRGIAGSVYNSAVVKKFLENMDTIVVTSPNMKASSVFLKDFQDKIVVIPPAVDLSKFYPVANNQALESIIHDKFGKHRQDIHLMCYVGRCGRYKGIKYLINSLKYLDEEYKLMMVVPQEDAEKLNKMIDSSVANRILTTQAGHDELRNYYSISDVLVLPSTDRGEAFGLVAIEAMACGVPVVTTELGTGTSYHNINGVTGVVIKPKNSKLIAEAVQYICENKDKFDKEKIIQRAKEFSLENFENRWTKMLKSVARKMENRIRLDKPEPPESLLRIAGLK